MMIGELDRELLVDLYRRRHDSFSESYAGTGWHRPMDLGATDGSKHSARLKQLSQLGFVLRERRGTLMNALRSKRGSYRYKISPKGIELVKSWGTIRQRASEWK